MREQFYGHVWTAGLWLRNRAKSASLLGPVEHSLLKLAPHLVPPPKTEILVHMADGMSMRVPPGYPAGRSFSAGMYEPEVTRLFAQIVQPRMTVVDAGANIGYYSLLASRLVGPEGRVYSFEPDSLSYSYLLDNLEANGCSNVTASRSALSNASGTARFIQDRFGAEGHLSEKPVDPEGVDVQISTLDGFFQERGWPSVAVVKMDIEGGERRALEGMRELSRRNPALALIMEWNTDAIIRSGDNVAVMGSLLSDLGFATGRVIESGRNAFALSTHLLSQHSPHNLLILKPNRRGVPESEAPA